MTSVLLASNDVNDLLSSIVKMTSINKLLVVGSLNKEIDYLDIQEIEIFSTNNPIDMAEMIMAQIVEDLRSLLVIVPNKDLGLLYPFYLIQNFTNSKAVMLIDERLITIPSFKIEELSPDEWRILAVLYRSPKFEQVTDLVKALNWASEKKSIAKAIYLVNKLKERDYVNPQKEGRVVSVEITEAGYRYYQLMQYVNSDYPTKFPLEKSVEAIRRD